MAGGTGRCCSSCVAPYGSVFGSCWGVCGTVSCVKKLSALVLLPGVLASIAALFVNMSMCLFQFLSSTHAWWNDLALSCLAILILISLNMPCQESFELAQLHAKTMGGCHNCGIEVSVLQKSDDEGCLSD
jgi:hypothetical protein